MTKEIKTISGPTLIIEKRTSKDILEINIETPGENPPLLHWGLCRSATSAWQAPPSKLWPQDSYAFNKTAIRTPFKSGNGKNNILIRIDRSMKASMITFVLFYPEENRWDNNNGKNYKIELSSQGKPSPSPSRALNNETREKKLSFQETVDLQDLGQIAIAAVEEGSCFRVYWITDIPEPLVLHWGVAKNNRFEWIQPPSSMRDQRTVPLDGKAAQTPFVFKEGLNRLELEFKQDEAPLGLAFLLKGMDSGQWIKKHGRNFFIPIKAPIGKGPFTKAPWLSEVAEEIIHVETGRNSWTLMHRFNLCHDLLDRVGGDTEGLALLYVWLRFSAVRQLDWQRNYNTQPKELSHAQERLTLKCSETYINSGPGSREFIRLLISSLGRGGEGQKIRDEILHIMHRRHIKEVSGHFMEEWHQKLHNNTTPDDVVICEGYLEFLRSNGDLNRFYETLKAGGVTRERLRGFERPIVTDPDFVHHLKDDLIHDFGNYLRLLRSVHSGTDLETSFNASRYLLDSEICHNLDYIVWNQGDPSKQVEDLLGRTIFIRTRLKGIMDLEKDRGRMRDLLYLDISLEEFSRVVVERNIHSGLGRDQLVELTGMALNNFCLSGDIPEFHTCYRHWERLKESPRFTLDWSLHAKSVIDRLGRCMGLFIDTYYTLLQPKADFLGAAFNAEPWTITLFSEEIVRGRPAFVLSMLMRRLDPILRALAKLGDWQVISPGLGSGRVEVVEALGAIQGKTFTTPTVMVADKVRGDEDIPRAVVAVITPDSTDIVSHVAVRARNNKLLFATCHDRDTVTRLKSLKGSILDLSVNAAGDVVIKEGAGETKPPVLSQRFSTTKIARPELGDSAITARDFREGVVGAKSMGLTRLQNKLPDWIHMPVSVALPFGVFEGVLEGDLDKDTAKHCRELINGLDKNPEKNPAGLQRAILGLKPTELIKSSLRRAMDLAGMKWPVNWDRAWESILRVWASKWNERAWLSRRSMGIANNDLYMAVLIQEVVEAEYSFVIHTANPFSGDNKELYAEVVLGLGETLVGNYPGRALSFTFKKDGAGPKLLSFPGKSVSLKGGGLIFRSDSNGEDLPGYAGAGLYDSVMLEPPVEKTLDYTDEPLVWDEKFRDELLAKIAKVGWEIENTMGSPQDIEGVYSDGKYYVVQTRPQV